MRYSASTSLPRPIPMDGSSSCEALSGAHWWRTGTAPGSSSPRAAETRAHCSRCRHASTLMITVTAGAAAVRSTTAIADACDTARVSLEGLQQPAVARDAADTVVLVASELVTNALRRGGGRCTLELTAHPDTIEVAVHDPSRHVPRVRTPDLNGGTGGLRLAHGHRPRPRHGGHPPGLRWQDREHLPCPVASPLKQPDGRRTWSASCAA
jgi:hypothetical protein